MTQPFHSLAFTRKKMENLCPQKWLLRSVQSRCIYNSLKNWKIPMFINSKADKGITVPLYNGILLSH